VAAQPPLYTWLQYLFFTLFGMNVFALAGLRAILQILTQAALYRSALLILDHRTIAMLVALSLWLIPQALGRVDAEDAFGAGDVPHRRAAPRPAPRVEVRRRRNLPVAGDGPRARLGVLAKYNFAIVAGALLLAGVWVEPVRRRLLDRRLWLGLGVAGLLVAPHLTWLLQHLDAATSADGQAGGVWTTREWTIRGAAIDSGPSAVNPFGYLPPSCCIIAVFGRPREAASEAAATVARLLERFWLIAFGILIVGGIVTSMAEVPRGTGFQPFLVVLSLYMFLRRPRQAPRLGRFAVFAAVLAMAMVFADGLARPSSCGRGTTSAPSAG
jgi:4-amino-4-deoxy-L-arabinose transferase-like glycosyltransferase